MATARKTDPQLWDKVKDEITASDKGGAPGQWSARKAQMAVRDYKKRGGGYAEDGPDQTDTHLHDWTSEDWGTRSGHQSGETGERYLPREVRMLLTEEDYARTTRKKRDGSGQFVDQPDDIREKVARIKRDGPTRQMLEARARDLEIGGRSKMSKSGLHDAIRQATDADGAARETSGDVSGLKALSKRDLYDRARRQDIAGRSRMNRDELIAALSENG